MSLSELIAKAEARGIRALDDLVHDVAERAADPAWVDVGVARLQAQAARLEGLQHGSALAVADVLDEHRDDAARFGHAALVDVVSALDLGDARAEEVALERIRSKATLAERLAARDAASTETREAVASDASAKRLAMDLLLAGGRFTLHLLLGIG